MHEGCANHQGDWCSEFRLQPSYKAQGWDDKKLVLGDQDKYGNPEKGPFWWSKEDRVRLKYDKVGGCETVPMLVAEL